jgi:hypothetical protein
VRFGAQVVQMLGAAEHWSERIQATRERSAQTFGVPMPKAWAAVGRMGAEAASFILRRTA